MCKHVLILAVVAAAILFGCSREEASVDHSNEFIVQVDDRVFSAHDLDVQIALRTRWMKRKYAGDGEALKSLPRFENELRVNAANGFIRKALYAEYAASNGFSVSESMCADRMARMAAFHGYPDARALTDELTADERSSLNRWLRLDLEAERGEKMIEDAIDDSVSDAEVDEGFRQLAEINKAAVATNHLIFAKAMNVYERIKSGELTFEKAVALYSEEDSKLASGLWGALRLSEIPGREPRLDALLKAGAKEGDVLPPIECNNAATIIKVGSTQKEMINLYWIMFRLPVEWNVPTREKMREVLSANKRKAEGESRFDALFRAARIRCRDDEREEANQPAQGSAR